jgi:hypothetical protein
MNQVNIALTFLIKLSDKKEGSLISTTCGKSSNSIPSINLSETFFIGAINRSTFHLYLVIIIQQLLSGNSISISIDDESIANFHHKKDFDVEIIVMKNEEI